MSTPQAIFFGALLAYVPSLLLLLGCCGGIAIRTTTTITGGDHDGDAAGVRRCPVLVNFLGGMGLIGLKDAYFVPLLSQSALEFSSTQQDGPGSLILTKDKMFMRVSRRREGFFYFDVSTGLIEPNRPSGIEIPRRSVRLPEKAGSTLTLFEFTNQSLI
jgi:hypothetical protein